MKDLEAGEMNRKLIRPDLTEMKDHRYTPVTSPKYFRQRRVTPPDVTNAESNYYLKQMANKTRMVIVLKDGEELRGAIEWYDRDAIKVHRPDAPNILLMKDNVKYMFKEDEDKDRDEQE
jgi:sRNA-binding regulator protein Hfq